MALLYAGGSDILLNDILINIFGWSAGITLFIGILIAPPVLANKDTSGAAYTFVLFLVLTTLFTVASVKAYNSKIIEINRITLEELSKINKDKPSTKAQELLEFYIDRTTAELKRKK
jgi:hypothetical protein